MKLNSVLIRCTMTIAIVAMALLASGCDSADILRLVTPLLL